ncbi:carbonyl reductase family member 4 isoform X3 [Hemibagrus wyckioides]|uniref:carbonyl reductase family member 4 isoform X3 n=1 Tax=Hemibagrus wyckioides TaxID=337641 RepID=UPI00266CA2EA|nr:carbonyl reductase family member 4 isoform X3 [Hemibagrus wyckioides]
MRARRLMSRLGVVFGGSRGIGRAVAQLLAQRGHRVVVLSRNQEAAQATAETLSGAEHVGLSCDVSKDHEVQRAFETITKTCGPVGYLVNAAGINRDALLMRCKSEDMVSVLHTNLLGSMLTCRAALRSMLTNGGAIVNIGLIRTDMTAGLNEEEYGKRIPLGRFGDPQEVAQAVMFLLESPYITGHVLLVDGGLHLTM